MFHGCGRFARVKFVLHFVGFACRYLGAVRVALVGLLPVVVVGVVVVLW